MKRQQPRPEGRKPTAGTTGPEDTKPKPDASIQSAYVVALRLLGRRELSEAQVRQRLARKGFESDDIDAAVERLRQERAIDDARVAEAIARTATTVKRRGRLRVRREIENAGIAPALARQASDAVFESVDADELLEAALRRRLPADAPIADQRDFNRLYRYLAAQGFESDKIVAVLNARRRTRPTAPEDAE